MPHLKRSMVLEFLSPCWRDEFPHRAFVGLPSLLCPSRVCVKLALPPPCPLPLNLKLENCPPLKDLPSLKDFLPQLRLKPLLGVHLLVDSFPELVSVEGVGGRVPGGHIFEFLI